MKITSVLLMAEIEPSIEFWTKRLGFEVTVSVPEGEKLGFAILQNGDAEVMLQSHASAAKDTGEITKDMTASLFIEVENFDEVLKRIEGYPVALPIRTTFYGMKEVGVREPGGNFLCFAAKIEQ